MAGVFGKNTPLWIVNILSLAGLLSGFVALWLFLPAVLVVLGVNAVKPGAPEFVFALNWGVPLMVLANLLSILVVKWSRKSMRGFLQRLAFVFTIFADIAALLIIVMKVI